jgi:hypothetical protein
VRGSAAYAEQQCGLFVFDCDQTDNGSIQVKPAT